MTRFAMAILACAIGAGAASAQGIMRREPAMGRLGNGEIVFVDDGTCPKGQIKKVTGGSGFYSNSLVGRRRTKECIPRPAWR